MLGELAGIASAALWALTSSVFGGLAERVPPVALSCLRLLCGVLFYAALVLATGEAGALAHLGRDRLLALVMVAWIGLGVGDTLYIAGVQTLGVGRASPVSVTSYPLLTIVVAWLALGEALSVRTGLAAALIVSGICLVVVTRSAPREGNASVADLAVLDAPDTAPLAASAGGHAAAPAVLARPVRPPAPKRRLWVGLTLVLASALAWAVSTVWLRALSLDTPLIVLNAVRVPAAAALLVAAALRSGSLWPQRYTAR
ncbi:MAG TPA: DMT family transporter, partial [Dehalococcoidia bacterium]|nr:DMT family transporter [Dehalococcoidia bacterium]